MYDFPKTEKALRQRISSYKSSMMKEKRKFGYVNDGAGKRYLLFSLYFVLNDADAARDYIEWYEQEFSDDVGEPIQKLCWALILRRLGKEVDARRMLAETMLANLYIIPKILAKETKEYDIRHSSSNAHMDYFQYMPKEVTAALTEAEMQWIRHEYESLDFRRIRQRYIDIFRKLKGTRDIAARGKLLDESYSLLDTLEQ